jgi:hypothetical protein
MTTIDTILTHPGGAHKDEFLACSVLVALYPVPILRREPTAADLARVATCVVDVGHEHTPERSNFDHHQLPKDYVPTCALSLVLQHLGLYTDAREFCDWLEPAEWFDCRGPHETARWLGVPRDALSKLNSPIDLTVLRRFASVERLTPGEPVWELMRMIGEDFLNYVKSLRARLDFLGHTAEFWEIELSGQAAKVLYLPRTEPLLEDPSMGLDRFVENRGLAGQVVGTIYPDRRSGGYGLSRFRDNGRLDFTRIAMCPEVHFAHARGFVAKTSATAVERLRELVVQAGTRPA